MQNLSFFQLFSLIAFAILAIIGVAVFALGGISFGKAEPLGTVIIWGVEDERVMNDVLTVAANLDERLEDVSYVQKDSRTFQDDFVNALATDSGPDLVLITNSDIVRLRDKLTVIPFDSYSERLFRDNFVEGAEIFLEPEGVVALPFSIDPMVLYWNRDIFSREGIAQPPRYWDEFFVMAPKVVKRDRSANIVQSFVPFGEVRNVTHAKDILSALILQAGNPIIERDERTGRLRSVLAEPSTTVGTPAESALRFYTEFSNPIKSVYSWNRSLPSSRQSFLAGDLALYPGFASERLLLRAANPNLNFDVLEFPQSRDTARPVVLGAFSGLAIARGAQNTQGAFVTATVLTSAALDSEYAALSGLPPVHRRLLGDIPSDAIGPVFYTSAVRARSWLDPNPETTNTIFQRMVENVVSGRERLNGAVETAEAELQNKLR